MSDEPVVAVTFRPQAWQNDYAVNVDPQGPTSWQVPASRLTGIRQHTYASDDLRNDPAAPQWCRDWTGPFEIEWDPSAVPSPPRKRCEARAMRIMVPTYNGDTGDYDDDKSNVLTLQESGGLRIILGEAGDTDAPDVFIERGGGKCWRIIVAPDGGDPLCLIEFTETTATVMSDQGGHNPY